MGDLFQTEVLRFSVIVVFLRVQFPLQCSQSSVTNLPSHGDIHFFLDFLLVFFLYSKEILENKTTPSKKMFKLLILTSSFALQSFSLVRQIN